MPNEACEFCRLIMERPHLTIFDCLPALKKALREMTAERDFLLIRVREDQVIVCGLIAQL